jgi:hypothetical protein
MPGKELAETRRYEVGDFPPGTRMLIADRRDLDAMLARGAWSSWRSRLPLWSATPRAADATGCPSPQPPPRM